MMVNDLDGLKRGDLVFWNGHVGIMTDSETLLHANGHHMMTCG
jgi:cell wall-associated NlpC family hydrolase